MAAVDPFVIEIPGAFLNNSDPDIRAYFQYLNRFLFDLWTRTGGANDAILTNDWAVNTEDSRRMPELRQLTKKVRQLELELDRISTAMNEIKRKANKPEEEKTLAAAIKRLETRIKVLELQ